MRNEHISLSEKALTRLLSVPDPDVTLPDKTKRKAKDARRDGR